METLLFLHGWGCSGETFAPVIKYFSQFYNCIAPDMPTPPPTEIWTLDDYTAHIEDVLKTAGVSKCRIIAHSFGARVTALLLSRNPALAHKIVIAGGAGLKPRFNILTRLKIRIYKIKKKLFKQTKGGSPDYRNLTPTGKATFVNIISRGLAPEISHLQTPTLLIAGARDRATPPYMAKRWARLAKNARYKIYKNCGHFCFLDDTARFINDVRGFFDE